MKQVEKDFRGPSGRLPEWWLGRLAVSCLVVFSWTAPLVADLGMASDDDNERLVVFDTTSGVVLGAVTVGPGAIGDCLVEPATEMGYVVDFANRLWVLDLAQDPPALADGVNPIAMSNQGQDIAFGPGRDFIVSCGGTTDGIVSVVDLASRTEVDTFDLGHTCWALEVCPDGSVLTGHVSFDDNTWNVRRLQLGPGGTLTDTGDFVMPDVPTNMRCSQDSATALVLQLGWDVSSVATDGLGILDTITLNGPAATAQFDPSGTRVYLRSDPSTVAYDYDPVSGLFGHAPLYTIPTGSFVPLGGVDTMALDALGTRLYIPSGDRVQVFDAVTGAPRAPIVQAGAGFIGVCTGRDLDFGDGFESGDLGAWSVMGR